MSLENETTQQDQTVLQNETNNNFGPSLESLEVNILMVTDGPVSYDEADFGLSEVLKALDEMPGDVSFKITKAHRRQHRSADYSHYRFTQSNPDLKSFDQVWLIGLETSISNIKVSDRELRKICEFMDNGGGIFATGDHEDLGMAMSARVPRVRNMRKWYYPNPGPNGEPVAPKVDGRGRYDTNRMDHNESYGSDNQSDDIPQEISPVFFPETGAADSQSQVMPHPVLSYRGQAIDVFPDHAHEGECYEPTDLDRRFIFDGYEIEEYPRLARTNQRLAPQVIAHAKVIGRIGDRDKGPVVNRNFGLVGVYDGHRVDRGRIVVDSTWHHFFNINIRGDGRTDPEDPKSKGFYFSSAGRRHLEKIKTYWRNIGVWNTPPSKWAAIAGRRLWALRYRHELLPEFRMAEPDLAECRRVGKLATMALSGTDSKSMATTVSLEILKASHPLTYETLHPLIDPWSPSPETVDPSMTPAVDQLLKGVLGAALYGIAHATDFDVSRESIISQLKSLENPEPGSMAETCNIRVYVDRFIEEQKSRLAKSSKALLTLSTAFSNPS